MDTPLSPLEVRIHLKSGLSYIIPRAGLDDTLRLIEGQIARVEHPKQVEVKPVEKATPVKNKASLLGKLLKDNKVTANELIDWINDSKSFEDIGIVMKGETRKTVKTAAKNRINEIL